MKTEQLTLITSITAAADLSASKNLFIGFDGAICANGAKALGVLNDTALLGEQAPVSVSGIALVIAGEAIAVGASVSSSATGKATVFDTIINGYALDASSTDGDCIRVKLV